MKLTMRRIFSFVLCAALILSVLPGLPAAAADGGKISNASISPNPYLLNRDNELEISFTLPEEMRGYTDLGIDIVRDMSDGEYWNAWWNERYYLYSFHTWLNSDDEGNFSVRIPINEDSIPTGRYTVQVTHTGYYEDMQYVGSFAVVLDPRLQDVEISPNPCYLDSTECLDITVRLVDLELQDDRFGDRDAELRLDLFLTPPNGGGVGIGDWAYFSESDNAWIGKVSLNVRDLAWWFDYNGFEEGDCRLTMEYYTPDWVASFRLELGYVTILNGSDPGWGVKASIDQFWLSGYWGEIDHSTGTITVGGLPYGTDLTALTPIFYASDGATVTVDGVVQDSYGPPRDFTEPVVYTVTSLNGQVTKDYIVTVSCVPPSAAAYLSGFDSKLPLGTELVYYDPNDRDANDFIYYVPDSADLSAVVSTFRLSAGATAYPASGQPVDFSDAFENPVKFTVTAQDGITQTVYTVTLKLKDEDSDLTGTVYTYENGVQTVNAGVKVYLLDLYWRSSYWSRNYFDTLLTTTTDSEGRYSFSTSALGAYSELFIVTDLAREYRHEHNILQEPGFEYVQESTFYLDYSYLMHFFKSVKLGEVNNLEYVKGQIDLKGQVLDSVMGTGLGSARVYTYMSGVEDTYTDVNGKFTLRIDYSSMGYSYSYYISRPKYNTKSFGFMNFNESEMYNSIKESGTITLRPVNLVPLDADNPFKDIVKNHISAVPNPVGRYRPVNVTVNYGSEVTLTDAVVSVTVPDGVWIAPGSCSNAAAVITDTQLTLRGDIIGGRQYSFKFWVYASSEFTASQFTIRADVLTNEGAYIGNIDTETVRLIGFKLYVPDEVGIYENDSARFDIYGDYSAIEGGRIAITVEGPDFQVYQTSKDLSNIPTQSKSLWFKADDVSILGAGLNPGLYTVKATLYDKNGAEVASVREYVGVYEGIATISAINLSSSGNYVSAPLPVNNSSFASMSLGVDSALNGWPISVSTKMSGVDDVTFASYILTTSRGTYTIKAGWNGEAFVGTFSGYSGSGQAMITLELTRPSGRISFTVAQLTLLVDPSGYVYDKESGEYVAGAVATLQVLENGEWTDWNAHDYAQHNNQVTDNLGRYGWFVPEGDYRVLVSADGYYDYDTLEDPAYGLITVLPPRDDINIGLTPKAEPAKVTSVSVTTPTLVATLEANLNITVEGQNLEGKTLTAYLSAGGELLFPTPVTITGGKWTARMHILKAPPHTLECAVVVSVDGGPAQGNCTITLAEYKPAELWTPSVYSDNDGGKVLVVFSDAIQPKTGGYTVKIGGRAYVCRQTDDKTLTIDIAPGDVPAGTPIIISGVKYPILFPSYSFTFTVAMP